MSFAFTIFLLVKESGDRLMLGLLEKGFSLSPYFTSGSFYAARNENSASHILSMRISHPKHTNLDKIEKAIGEVLVEKLISYYGSVIQGDNKCRYTAGIFHKPESKDDEDLDTGNSPYRGNVFPLK